jgi:hypothetical protein
VDPIHQKYVCCECSEETFSQNAGNFINELSDTLSDATGYPKLYFLLCPLVIRYNENELLEPNTNLIKKDLNKFKYIIHNEFIPIIKDTNKELYLGYNQTNDNFIWWIEKIIEFGMYDETISKQLLLCSKIINNSRNYSDNFFPTYTMLYNISNCIINMYHILSP